MAKEKKAKKEKKEGSKPRKKTPWKERQMMRYDRAMKAITKLNGVLVASKAPNVTSALITAAYDSLKVLGPQLTALPVDWKPEKGHAPPSKNKLGIGSIVRVKSDLNHDEIKMFKHLKVDLFDGAEIIDDDTRDWMVKCKDGMTRVLKKKLTEKWSVSLPVAPDTKEVTKEEKPEEKKAS